MIFKSKLYKNYIESLQGIKKYDHKIDKLQRTNKNILI